MIHILLQRPNYNSKNYRQRLMDIDLEMSMVYYYNRLEDRMETELQLCEDIYSLFSYLSKSTILESLDN